MAACRVSWTTRRPAKWFGLHSRQCTRPISTDTRSRKPHGGGPQPPDRHLFVDKPLQPKAFAHGVDVQAELAGSIETTFVFLGRLPLSRGSRNRFGVCPWYHANAVVIGDDHVAGADADAGADDGHLAIAKRFLHRSLGEDSLRPNRKLHCSQSTHVAHAGVDHETPDAERHRRFSQKVA